MRMLKMLILPLITSRWVKHLSAPLFFIVTHSWSYNIFLMRNIITVLRRAVDSLSQDFWHLLLVSMLDEIILKLLICVFHYFRYSFQQHLCFFWSACSFLKSALIFYTLAQFLSELTLNLFPHPVLCPACQLWTRRPAVDWASWPSPTTCGPPSLPSLLASCWCWSSTQGRAPRKTTTTPVRVLWWHRQTPCWTWSGNSPQASLEHKDNAEKQRNTTVRGFNFTNCAWP